MSQFIDSVQEQLTGRRQFMREPMAVAVPTVHESMTPMPEMAREMVEYDISVEYRRVVYCLPEDHQAMLENFVRALRDAVYGDFKHRVLQLELALYAQDHDAAICAIRDIVKEIFE